MPEKTCQLTKDLTPEKITDWEYLNPLAREIVQSDDLCIGLLTGTNFMKALEPIQVVASESGGIYA